MKTNVRAKVCAWAVAGLVVAMPFSTAMATFDLQITEIWMGNEPGSNLSEDWFEVTNYGDMAWTAATDGDLYYDDDSADTGTADLMSGIATIAPGESVIFVDGGALGSADWTTLWSPVLSGTPQVGSFDGSGLGQGGDAVTLFIDDVLPAGPPSVTQIDFESFPDANANGGQSYDIYLSAFSTVGNASGAVATIALNDENQAAIGSPGTVAPEPGTMGLLVLGALTVLNRRRG